MSPDSVKSNAPAAEVRTWRTTGARPPPVTRRRLRWKQPLFLIVVATLLSRFTEWQTLPKVLLVIAAILTALSIGAPRAAAAVDGAMHRLGLAVGQVLNWILLTPCFFCLFLPVKTVRRLRRRDAMTREFPAPQIDSFWQPCEQPSSSQEGYRWQH